MDAFQLSRRAVMRFLPAFTLPRIVHAQFSSDLPPESPFAGLDHTLGGRMGVAAVDTGTGRRLGYRASELFAMCSTFKLLLAACILSRVDQGVEHLDRPVSYSKRDLLEYAPITAAHLSDGSMPVGELCAAAVELSDNTAANLLLALVGGPAGLTAFLRTLGNTVTRLDRIEPQLNSALAGDVRDTTSPQSMVDSMQRLLTGNALSDQSRKQLAEWLELSSTGGRRLRAGIPAGWSAGDKTGSGERGATGDVGILWPPGNAPILIAAYLMEGAASIEQREMAIASVGRIIARWASAQTH